MKRILLFLAVILFSCNLFAQGNGIITSSGICTVSDNPNNLTILRPGLDSYCKIVHHKAGNKWYIMSCPTCTIGSRWTEVAFAGDGVVTGATLNGNVLTLARSNGLPSLSVTLTGTVAPTLFRGTWDASGGTLPTSGGSGAAGAVVAGDFWLISIGGTLPTGITPPTNVVVPQQMLVAVQNNPNSTTGVGWNTVQSSFPTYSGSTYIDVTAGVISNKGDTSNVNEIQQISIVGSAISLSKGGGTINLPAAAVQSVTGAGDVTVTNTSGAVTVGYSDGDKSSSNEIQTLSKPSQGTLKLTNGANASTFILLPDTSSTNEYQNLSWSNYNLLISNGTGVVFSKMARTNSYDSLSNKPATFPPSTHSHTISQVTNLNDSLTVKSRVGHGHSISQITNLTDSLNTKSRIGHGHTIGQVTNLTDSLNTKSRIGHTHDYSSLSGIPSSFTPSTHSHVQSQVTNLSDSLNVRSRVGHTHTYSSLSGIPSTFTPSSHTHVIPNITNLQDSLNTKSNISHTHNYVSSVDINGVNGTVTGIGFTKNGVGSIAFEYDFKGCNVTTDNNSAGTPNGRYVIVPKDTSDTNEIEIITTSPVVGQVATWDGSKYVNQNAASGADNWGNQVVARKPTHLIGDGTSLKPLGLRATGVSAGTYNSVTVDTTGRVTSASNVSASFSSLTGKPTTLSGYGITDAYPLTGNPSNFLTSITSGNVTTALGFTPYNATNPSNYIALTGLSSTATGLTYTNTTGVFSLTSGYSIPTTANQAIWSAKQDAITGSESVFSTWDKSNFNEIQTFSKPSVGTLKLTNGSSASTFIMLPDSSNTNEIEITNTSPSVGQVATWDGSKYVNATPSGGGSGGLTTGSIGYSYAHLVNGDFITTSGYEDMTLTVSAGGSNVFTTTADVLPYNSNSGISHFFGTCSAEGSNPSDCFCAVRTQTGTKKLQVVITNYGSTTAFLTGFTFSVTYKK